MKEITIDGVTYVLTPKEEKAVEQKSTLPKTWEELKTVAGCYVRTDSSVHPLTKMYCCKEHKNIFATQEQAEASIALAQLTQLREAYRAGWIPDWSDVNRKDNYCIYFSSDQIFISGFNHANRFLAFQSEEIAQEFLDNFSDLILKAQPLLG